MANIYRLMRLGLYFLIGLCLGGVFTLAHAETIAATGTLGYATTDGYFLGSAGDKFTIASATAWCTARPAAIGSSGTGVLTETGTSVTYHCMLGTTDLGYFNFTCPSGYTANGAAKTCTATTQTTIYSCPSGQNWTLSGSTCTRPDCTNGRNADGTCMPCASGYTLDGGTCKQTCASAGTYDSNKAAIVSGKDASIPSTVCYQGCYYNQMGLAVGTSTGWAGEVGTSTGVSCSTTTYGSSGSATTNATSASAASDAAYKCLQNGMATGTVNGQTVCVPATTTTQASSSNSSSSTTNTTASNSSTTTANPSTSSSSSTSCTNGTCTTTTTTTTTNPDGSKSSTTTAANQDEQSFCAQNPTLAICKTSAYTDGGCTAQPACDGDAIQCAQANQLWKLKCDMETEPTSDAYTLGKSLAAGGTDPKGNPLDSANVTSVDVGSIVSTAAGTRTLSGSCISSPSVSVMGRTFTMDTTLLCQFASIVGYLMVAASSIIAIRMVTAGV